MDNLSFCVFDLETGGMDALKNPILEFGLIPIIRNKKGELEIIEKTDCDDNESYENTIIGIDTIINPAYNKNLIIEEKALQVNKLDLNFLKKNGANGKDVIEEIIRIIEIINPKNKERDKPILVGHNIDKFDIPFLEQFFYFYKKNLYDYFCKSTIDTYSMARAFFGGNDKIQSLSLENLCNFLNINLKNSHAAYDDALANAKMFIKMTKIFNRLTRKNLLDL